MFQRRTFLAGTGVLIYGMTTIEDTVKYLGGKKLKQIIERYTKTSRMSIRTGTRTTSVLQSSTLVSLLVLAFAGAGVMSLSNAIGVIIGANIGSPVLPFLAAVIGFGEFEISAFALPILAIAGCALIFLKKEHHIQIAKLSIGIALLFVGLDFMKQSVDALQASFDLTQYADLSLRGFGLMGIIVTIVLRSSGALSIMTLSALDAGIISFPASIAVIMGANIGTTFTAVLASFGGDTIKRQIALSHVIFNVLSGIIGVLLFRQYIWFTLDVLGYENNLVMGNAVLNILFNASTAILIGFFVKPFTKMILRLLPSKKEDSFKLHILQTVPLGKDGTFAQAGLLALREDCKTLIQQTFEYNTYVFGLVQDTLADQPTDVSIALSQLKDRNKTTHKTQYERAKHVGNSLLEYIIQLRTVPLPEDASRMTSHLEDAINASLRSTKCIKNIYRDLQNLRATDHPLLKDLFNTFIMHTIDFYGDVNLIIDKQFTVKNLDELKKAYGKIKKFHESFMHDIPALVRQDATDDVEISVLVNIDYYLHQAAQLLIHAIEQVYLTDDEAHAFRKFVDPQEK